jgi:PLD-like domain
VSKLPARPMPRFLTTKDLSVAIHEVIGSAQGELLLLSPYLKLSEPVRELLLERDCRRQPTRVLCRNVKSFQRAIPALKGLPCVEVRFAKTLHAKCYVNEQTAVVTSMNLHEYSQEHNDEMGFVVTQRDAPGLFDQIHSEARRLVAEGSPMPSAVPSAGAPMVPVPARGEIPSRTSLMKVMCSKGHWTYFSRGLPERCGTPGCLRLLTHDTLSVVDGAASDGHAPPLASTALEPELRVIGFCIACGENVPFDKREPYCRDDRELARGTWGEDDDFPEIYCHMCGEPRDTCFRKPFCRSCYRRMKEAQP